MELDHSVVVDQVGCSPQIYLRPMKRFPSISSLLIYFQILPSQVKQITLNPTQIKMGLGQFLFVLLHQQFHRYHLPYQNSRQSQLIQINQTKTLTQKCQNENRKRALPRNFLETKNAKSANQEQPDFIIMYYRVKRVK